MTRVHCLRPADPSLCPAKPTDRSLSIIYSNFSGVTTVHKVLGKITKTTGTRSITHIAYILERERESWVSNGRDS